jgi:hypothetical protein
VFFRSVGFKNNSEADASLQWSHITFFKGISPRTRNDVESTANGQRAGGPLHLKDLPAVPMSRVVARP